MANQLNTAPVLKTRDAWKAAGFRVPTKAKPAKLEQYLVPGYRTVYRTRHLYSQDQVIEVSQAESMRRREAGLKAAETSARKTMEYAASCPIDVKVVSEAELQSTSIATYLGSYEGYREYPGFGPRQAVNCLRHNYTRYEKHLAWLDGRVASDAAYLKLKRRVLDAIAVAYPQYKSEVDAQQYQLAMSAR